MIIVIAGPTAVGKTKLSIELAKKYNAEIINYDSVQIYKDMNIASAKVTKEEAERFAKLEKTLEEIQKAEVQLKVVKPATALNKEASISVAVPGQSFFVEKVCDTFEESVDQCVDSLKVQLTKFKEKRSNR